MVARRRDHLRQNSSFLLGERRREQLDRCNALLEDIEEVDRQLAELAGKRHRLVVELKKGRARLMPRLSKRAIGRQPVADGSARLPPLAQNPTPLWGRRLRSTCVALLRRAGDLSLPELHALLHHHGYRVDSVHHVRVLSDAMSYEVEQGRIRRVERGVYGPLSSSAAPARSKTTLAPAAPCTPMDHLSDTIAPRAA